MQRKLISFFILIFISFPSFSTIFFKETFDRNWKERWVFSENDPDLGKWVLSPGKWFGNPRVDIGLKSKTNNKLYAISSKFWEEIQSTENKTIVIQFSVKFTQDIECGGGYIQIFGSDADQKVLDRENEYKILFGPDICAKHKRIQFILGYNNSKLMWKKVVDWEKDKFTHVYTLVLKPENQYEVWVDLKKIESGSLLNDWNFNQFEEYIESNLENQNKNSKKIIFKNLGLIALKFAQVQSGTIFDNILITDDFEYAVKFAQNTWGKSKEIEKEKFFEIQEKMKIIEEKMKRNETIESDLEIESELEIDSDLEFELESDFEIQSEWEVETDLEIDLKLKKKSKSEKKEL
ncbi:calreticulin-3 [Anaeramoeba ignava]|uniref:Calreticulin-3 n=1 Tax=Anaeramoeba ignava TaxID=1746090 RepID=A0A9Q0LSJ8_ANAIG|nr:calreticulin-3 [Anaeramoeba ignava]